MKTEATLTRELLAEANQLAAALQALKAAAEPAMFAATLPPFVIPPERLAPLAQALGDATAILKMATITKPNP